MMSLPLQILNPSVEHDRELLNNLQHTVCSRLDILSSTSKYEAFFYTPGSLFIGSFW